MKSINKENLSKSIKVTDIKVTDNFWFGMMEKVRTHVIPYQWEALNDRIEGAEPSYCVQNFKVAAGMTLDAKKLAATSDGDGNPNNRVETGKFNGCVFQDSDFVKWIEAVGFSLAVHKDEELEKTADYAIDLICAAQQQDGYLDTYYIINGLDKRFTNLKDNHELYCLGHMIEAAVAYYEGTGKDKLLKAVIKYVDCVDKNIGAEDSKLHGYPGHEVLELALIKLYSITKDKMHLKLAKYFVDQRGKSPLFFEEENERNGNEFFWKNSPFLYQYYQAGKPVRDQKVAEGHAVRAVYLYSGMVDVAKMTDDEELLECCEKLWNNIVTKQMYVTGAIGQSEYGESFLFDYELPNDTVYAETCAAIGLVFFAKRMLEVNPKSEYADVMERALFNGVISGMSLDGKSFFYVNPLEVVPKACEKDPIKRHVKVQRQKWFGCSCCPPNIARLLASIGTYAYTLKPDTIYTHLFMGGSMTADMNGKKVGLNVETNYPWDETVTVKFSTEEKSGAEFTYAVRIPAWCKSYKITLNGEKINPEIVSGYASIKRNWSDGDVLELTLDMPVTLVESNPRVRENIGKVAVTRGPIVFCLEQDDNGEDLHRIFVGENPEFNVTFEEDLLDGVVVLTSVGRKLCEDSWSENTLYKAASEPKYTPKNLKWIPYYSWANRNPGEMMVWVRK